MMNRNYLGLERVRWLILALLFFSTVINYLDRQALSVLLPVLRTELGITSAIYGTITTLFLIAYTVSQFFSGVVIDRIGTKKGFALAIITWSLAAIAHVFAKGPISLGIFRFVLGLGEAGNWPAGGKAIARWFPRDRRAFAMAVFDGGSAVGAIIAPPLIAGIALNFGWRSAFVIVGLLGFLWLGAWWWIYQSPEEHRWLSDEDRAKAMEGLPPVASIAPASNAWGAGMRDILRIRALWGLMATRMLATPVWWFYVFWLPDYLAKDRGFTLAQIGMFAWIPYLTVDFGKLFGGALSDRLLRKGVDVNFARKGTMFVGALLMAAGVFVAGAETAAGALAWASMATFGFGMWSANILALHADVFPERSMASALGMTGMAASFGGAVFTFSIGLAVDRLGYAPVFWVVGTAALAACGMLFWGVGRISSQGKSAA